uniref:U44-Deinotoxin-Dsu1k_1 n=1 Tax=Deinopis subrufa TaxID=1905329 RepID=A0A4Q8KAI4_DEISU
MIFLCVLISASTLALSTGNENYLLDHELKSAIDENLAKYDVLEKTFKSIYSPEQLRDEENCLHVGSKCSFNSGPRCCGIRTRCNIFDTQEPATTPGGSAKWIAKCREYNLGVILEAIGDIVKNLEPRMK